MIKQCAIALGLMLNFAISLQAEDWPQWMGTHRDGVCRETGLVARIPASGLPEKWRVPVGAGYSGPAVADGRVFLTDFVKASGTSTNNPGGRDKVAGTERVLCFDANTGRELWRVEDPREYNLSYANGPRATPTVDGNRVYTLGAEGDLQCLQVATGNIIGKKQLAQEFKAESPMWGHAAHPLVHGDLLYCLAGGQNSVVVALDKLSGQLRWQALSASEIGYCPPTIQKLGGQEQLLIWHADALNALQPQSGKVLWTYPLIPRYGMAIAAPQVSGNRLYACGIGETAVMLEIKADGSPGEALWNGKTKIGGYNGNATELLDGQHIYGADCGSGAFIAVNAANGERYWETFALTTGGDRRASHGTAFAIKHEDKFILFTETGDLVFAKFSPAGFEELGRMHLLEPTSEGMNRSVVWSHPAIANQCLFARNDKELVCVSLAAQ